MSACKYLSQNQCCNQVSQSKQENIIGEKGYCFAGLEDIVQQNENQSYSQCRIASESNITDKLAADIKNKLSQRAENKAEGLTMGMMLIIILVILAVLGGAGYIYYKSYETMSKFIVLLVGVVLLAVGIVLIFVYNMTKKPGVTTYDQPFINCQEGARAEQSARTTFGETVTHTKNNIGYDFFLDKDAKDKDGMPIDDVKAIPDEATGMAVFLNEAKREKTPGCPPLEDGVHTASFIRPVKYTKILIIAIILVIIGVAASILGAIILIKSMRGGAKDANDAKGGKSGKAKGSKAKFMKFNFY
jgi:flagellar basal body-associated protein FliL